MKITAKYEGKLSEISKLDIISVDTGIGHLTNDTLTVHADVTDKLIAHLNALDPEPEADSGEWLLTTEAVLPSEHDTAGEFNVYRIIENEKPIAQFDETQIRLDVLEQIVRDHNRKPAYDPAKVERLIEWAKCVALQVHINDAPYGRKERDAIIADLKGETETSHEAELTHGPTAKD